jgi:hypothetical protein
MRVEEALTGGLVLGEAVIMKGAAHYTTKQGSGIEIASVDKDARLTANGWIDGLSR